MPQLEPAVTCLSVQARYCEALDTKIFSLLNKVFVSDVIANYPFNPDLKGVDAVSNAIQNRSAPLLYFIGSCSSENRLGPIRTHHSLTTQLVVFGNDSKTANTVTYFVGSHFGQGKHAGKVLQAYGRYVDELVLLDAQDGDYEGVPGASGVWRIKRRTVMFTARIGDEDIMKEY